MKARGLEFINKIPDSYYTLLKKNLEKSNTKILEDIDIVSIKSLMRKLML